LKIKRELLIKAAEELNEVMGLRPPIDTKDDDESIKAKIIKALELREEEDEFSSEVEEVLAQLETEAKNYEEEDVDVDDLKEEKEAVKEKEKGTKNKKKRKMSRLAFLTSLIEERKYTRKELVEKTIKQFPGTSKSSIHTILSDAKNPKYRKLKRLVAEDERGVLYFVSDNSGKKVEENTEQ